MTDVIIDADPRRNQDDDEEAMLRASVPVRTMVRLHELKILTGRTVQDMVNDAVHSYLELLREQAGSGDGRADGGRRDGMHDGDRADGPHPDAPEGPAGPSA